MAGGPEQAGGSIAQVADHGKSNGSEGGPAVTRPTRTQLLFNFDMHREVEESRQYFLPDAYPPSITPIEELRLIQIADLRPETHHRGRVLFMRNIEDAVRFAAVRTIVEDETGTTDSLALYNTAASLKAEDVIPSGAVFAVKEPYYTVSPNGGYTIRVDHPSDLTQFPPASRLLPETLRAKEGDGKPQSAIEWKDAGNTAFKAKDYLAASRCYSYGLEACGPGDEDTKGAILRNLATINLNLQRYEHALADATSAIQPESEELDDRTADLNSKAYYRAGRAWYELGVYGEAKSFFERVLAIKVDDKDATTELIRVQERWDEWQTGEYDWAAMSRPVNKRHNRLDHADYIRNTETKDAGVRGRGLFAIKDIKAGELIMCEKAFAVSFDSDVETAHSYAILDSKTKRGAIGTQATLLLKLVDKLLYSPDQAKAFFNLDDGGYNVITSLDLVDRIVPVDAFRVQGIVDHNSYGCPTVRSSSTAAQKQLTTRAGYPSTGLWLRASYINHACDGNAMRSFIGDMMIVRATKDITAGTEIMMPYRLPHYYNSITQEELEKIWGFKCDCGLCVAEAEMPFRQREERRRLIDKACAIINSTATPDKKTIMHAQRLYIQIASTYDGRLFNGRPRLGLVQLGKWLCDAHSRCAGNEAQVKQASVDLLRDMGILIHFANDEVEIDRKLCQLHGTATDAAMYAARALKRQGKEFEGVQMEGLAEELYTILNGELRGFEEMYAKSCRLPEDEA